MQKPIEWGNRIKTMGATTYEIHHNKDAFTDFLFPNDAVNTVPLHDHDFYEVYCFLAGSVRYNVESRLCDLKPGDILLIPPGTLHQPLFYRSKGDYERVVLWISAPYLLSLTRDSSAANCFLGTRGGGNLIRPPDSDRAHIISLMDNLAANQHTDIPLRELRCRSLLNLLLCELNRLALAVQEAGTGPRSSDTILAVLDHVNEALCKPLFVEQLAERFFISKSHLLREFKRLMGTSLHRYIVQKRLILAKQYLQEGIPPMQASLRCGFGEYTSFFRAFRREYGVTPTEYLRMAAQCPR